MYSGYAYGLVSCFDFQFASYSRMCARTAFGFAQSILGPHYFRLGAEGVWVETMYFRCFFSAAHGSFFF